MKKKILIIDDEEDLCEILKYNLTNAGYDADVSYSAEDAFTKLKNGYDLLLLDVMLGGISGFKLAELIRGDYNYNIPIIFITAKDSEKDRLTGFGIGGDDYILKPFSVREVVARVKAVLSRVRGTRSSESEISVKADNPELENKFEEMHVNNNSKTLTIEGKHVELTKKEYEILYTLISEKSKLFSRNELLVRVWKNETYVLERTVDVHIARLRKKLGKYSNCIVNKSGFGYYFEIDYNKKRSED